MLSVFQELVALKQELALVAAAHKQKLAVITVAHEQELVPHIDDPYPLFSWPIPQHKGLDYALSDCTDHCKL